MISFYRKERPEIFNQRFSAPSQVLNAWALRSDKIFEAKKTVKVVTIQAKKITCTVQGTNIILSGLSKIITIPERDIANLLQSKSDDVKCLVLKQICKDHATSSRSSILLSGCVSDNFSASKTYPGHKLCVELKARKPFCNPFASGLEKEYFLIGTLKGTDCNQIKYFGNTNEKLNELVNFFGSKISRPTR
jgi:hypothetical protein